MKPKNLDQMVEVELNRLISTIKSRREELDLTQEAMAERVGVSYNQYKYIEQGRRRPSIEVFVKICIVLELKSELKIS